MTNAQKLREAVRLHADATTPVAIATHPRAPNHQARPPTRIAATSRNEIRVTTTTAAHASSRVMS